MGGRVAGKAAYSNGGFSDGGKRHERHTINNLFAKQLVFLEFFFFFFKRKNRLFPILIQNAIPKDIF